MHIYIPKQAESGSVPANQQIGGLLQAAACSCSRPGGYGELAATPLALVDILRFREVPLPGLVGGDGGQLRNHIPSKTS